METVIIDGRIVMPSLTPDVLREQLRAAAKALAVDPDNEQIDNGFISIPFSYIDKCTDADFCQRVLTPAYIRVIMNRVKEVAAVGCVKILRDTENQRYRIGLVRNEERNLKGESDPSMRKVLDNAAAVKALKEALKVRIDLMDVDIDDMPATKRAVELYRAEIQKLIEDVD
jgi:hypothetical protein